MVRTHNLGFPRIGAKRELKFALEAYWKGQSSLDELKILGAELRRRHWLDQASLGLAPVGDFSFYDQVLDTSFMVGNLPERVRELPGDPLDNYFRVARGRSARTADEHANCRDGVSAGEMTKWFDTNYHYIVPEFSVDTEFRLNGSSLREGLPLRKAQWREYLDWAVNSFRLTANGVADETQIHTHMCYSEFNDIIASIAEMDADVITIESSRSDMELLEAFDDFNYPNEIGPGVYDIHSPNIPSVEQIVDLMTKATAKIPAERLWVNPDCGLKTRQWNEVLPALLNMVTAAMVLRASID